MKNILTADLLIKIKNVSSEVKIVFGSDVYVIHTIYQDNFIVCGGLGKSGLRSISVIPFWDTERSCLYNKNKFFFSDITNVARRSNNTINYDDFIFLPYYNISHFTFEYNELTGHYIDLLTSKNFYYVNGKKQKQEKENEQFNY